jgi:hypothetical protein
MWSIGMILLEMSVKIIPWKTAHEKELLNIFKNIHFPDLFGPEFD